MALDWERQAVIDELTQNISQGTYDNNYEQLKLVLHTSDACTEADRQRLVQFWLARQRERGRGSAGE